MIITVGNEIQDEIEAWIIPEQPSTICKDIVEKYFNIVGKELNLMMARKDRDKEYSQPRPTKGYRAIGK